VEEAALTSTSPTFEFHVSRRARDRLQFDDGLFTITGNVVFANFQAARTFAQKMNDQRDLVSFPEQAVKPGQISAMGLIDEILHFVVGQYREQVNRDAAGKALGRLEERAGGETLDKTLRSFADTFPTVAVYRRQVDLDAYLAGETDGTPNREIILEELLMLWLANVNPAFSPYLELFDDADLRRETAYLRIMAELHAFFETQPPFGPDNQNLIDMLRAPALASPHSLEGQLNFMLERWGALLGRYLYRLLSSLDVIKEERKLVFLGPGPTRVYEFGELDAEPEGFSSPSSTGGTSTASTRSRMRSWTGSPAGASPGSGSLASGSAAPRRSGSSSSAAIRTRSPRHTRSMTTPSPTTWAAPMPTRT
jgi:hypothetical protein